MIDLNSLLGEHALQVAVAEPIAQMPCHRLHDPPRLGMAAFEIVLRQPLQPLGDRVQNHKSALKSEDNLNPSHQSPVNRKNLRQARLAC
jgi:hypothetical protein